MRHTLSLLFVLAVHGFPSPSSAAAQTPRTMIRGWIAIGAGVGVFGSETAGGALAELAFQHGHHLVALRSSGGDSDWKGGGVRDIAIVYGRATTGEGKHLSVAVGLAWVDSSYCYLFGGCTGESALGVPIVAEISSPHNRFLGTGLQVFGNLNSLRSFIGMAVVLKAGSLR